MRHLITGLLLLSLAPAVHAADGFFAHAESDPAARLMYRFSFGGPQPPVQSLALTVHGAPAEPARSAVGATFDRDGLRAVTLNGTTLLASSAALAQGPAPAPSPRPRPMVGTGIRWVVIGLGAVIAGLLIVEATDSGDDGATPLPPPGGTGASSGSG